MNSGLDLDRRSMLGGIAVGTLGLACIAQAGLDPSAAASRALSPDKYKVLVETSSPESRKFAAALAGAQLTAVDPTLTDLLQTLADQGPGRVIGLTSDPVAMIGQQLLGERGGRLLFRWVHSYARGQWWHAMDEPASLLAGTGTNWPVTLAQHVEARIGGVFNAVGADQCSSGSCRLHRSSPGLLVCWAIDMSETV